MANMGQSYGTFESRNRLQLASEKPTTTRMAEADLENTSLMGLAPLLRVQGAPGSTMPLLPEPLQIETPFR